MKVPKAVFWKKKHNQDKFQFSVLIARRGRTNGRASLLPPLQMFGRAVGLDFLRRLWYNDFKNSNFVKRITMVKLRNFAIADAEVLRQEHNHNMSIEEIQDMICDWNKLEFQGKYFEMFAIVDDDKIVGEISLYQRSDSVISIGLEVFLKFQRQGFGKQAAILALQICKSKGYKIVYNQVLSDNTASIALNKSLGFETDMYRYKNQKDKEVYLFLKSIV